MKLIEQIEAYQPFNTQEAHDKAEILDQLRAYDNIFTRGNRIAHMTASAWVTNKGRDKVLMIHHNLYDSWAWLGGHADGCKDLLEVAIKEVQEESGLEDVHAISEEIFSLEILTVDGHVRRGEYVPSHLHLNVTYMIEADDSHSLTVKPDENSGVTWFSLDQAVEASSEPWFRKHVYGKLNDKLRSGDYE